MFQFLDFITNFYLIFQVAPAVAQKTVYTTTQSSSSGVVQKKIIAPNLQQLLQPGNTKVVLAQQPGQSQAKIILNQTVVQPGAKQIIIKQPQIQQKIVINAGGKLIQTNASALQGNKQIIVGGQRILLNSNQGIVTQAVPQASQQVVPEEKVSSPVVQVQKQTVETAQATTTTSTPSRLIVQNQTLAQQISSGKVQIATVNGQQVLIRQTGNNQAVVVAHIKPQTEGPAQVVPIQQSSSQPAAAQVAQPAPAPAPVQSPPPIQQKIVQTTSSSPSNSNNDLPPATEQALLKGQPPGTVIKCVTAQVIQTQQGPRIVLQGLHGADFTQQQSALVQQQVKQQLLKGRSV